MNPNITNLGIALSSVLPQGDRSEKGRHRSGKSWFGRFYSSRWGWILLVPLLVVTIFSVCNLRSRTVAIDLEIELLSSVDSVAMAHAYSLELQNEIQCRSARKLWELSDGKQQPAAASVEREYKEFSLQASSTTQKLVDAGEFISKVEPLISADSDENPATVPRVVFSVACQQQYEIEVLASSYRELVLQERLNEAAKTSKVLAQKVAASTRQIELLYQVLRETVKERTKQVSDHLNTVFVHSIGLSLFTMIVAVSLFILHRRSFFRPDSNHTDLQPAEEIRIETNLDLDTFDEQTSNLAGCRVLAVEDGNFNQKFIRTVLERAGAVVEIAADGKQGVEAALHAEDDGCPFDVVLMDLEMPTMDGFEAMAKLQEAEFVRPIIVVSAHEDSERRERAKKLGCVDFLCKPFDRQDLLRMVQQHVRVRLKIET